MEGLHERFLLSVKQGKTYTSIYNGTASIPKHLSGHFNFTISADGYQQQTLGLDIKKSVHNPFEVRLEKEV